MNQLCGLERRTARSGRDSIDPAPGAHDDIANSVAGLAASTLTKYGSYDVSMWWVLATITTTIRTVPALSGWRELGKTLAAAKGIDDAYWRSDTLAALAPHLTPDQLGEALIAAKGIDDADARSRALAALAAHLTPDQLGEALTAAKGVDDADAHSHSLAALAKLACSAPAAVQVNAILMLIDFRRKSLKTRGIIGGGGWLTADAQTRWSRGSARIAPRDK